MFCLTSRRVACLALALAGLLVTGAQARGDFNYDGFASTAGLVLNGTAERSGSNLRLASPARQGAGSAWYATQQPISGWFSTTFDFEIHRAPGSAGGDGIALVVQDVGTSALGLPGRGIGYSGIPRSVAVEWDTWYNGADGNFDPSDNHISVQTRGLIDNHDDHRFSLGSFTDFRNDFQDGRVHRVRVEYLRGSLSIWSDNRTATPTLRVPVDLARRIGAADGMAWIGFTSSTGFGIQSHDILRWRFATGPSMPGDANIDGAVNGTDFALLARNFGVGSGADWGRGDFNHDGAVNGTDFALLAGNFGRSAAGPAPIGDGDWRALEAFSASAGVPVPEPGVAAPAALALAGVGLRRRRRRR